LISSPSSVGLIFLKRDDSDQYWQVLLERTNDGSRFPGTIIRTNELPRDAVMRFIKENYDGRFEIRDWISRGVQKLIFDDVSIETQIDYYLCVGEYAKLVAMSTQAWVEYDVARVTISHELERNVFFDAVNYHLRKR